MKQTIRFSVFLVLQIVLQIALGSVVPNDSASPASDHENELEKTEKPENDDVKNEKPGHGSKVVAPPFIPIIEGFIVGPEDASLFGSAAGAGGGSVASELLGISAGGFADGIGGAFLNQHGVGVGGSGGASGAAGIDTEPFKVFGGIEAAGSASLNTFGANPHKFVFIQPSGKSEIVELRDEKNNGENTSGAAGGLLGTLGLFRPVSSASEDSRPRPGILPVLSAIPDPLGAGDAIASVTGGLYSFIRPITPAGISETVHGFFRPLASLSGQAQGSITLSGGGSFTGNPPEETEIEIEVPIISIIPELEQCKLLCKTAGKTGGHLVAPGNCCSCACPVPEPIPGKLCCTGSNIECNNFCQNNNHHNYTGGACNSFTRACECSCKINEPCWGKYSI